MFLLCRMFTSPRLLTRCVGKQTPAAPEVQLRDVVWSDESFFLLREQPNHQNTRIRWGQPCLAIVSAHVFLASCGACIALPQVMIKPSVERRVQSWRILGTFFSLLLPRIWLSRSTSKIDALDDDETPLRYTSSQTATTRGVMVSGIMGALDIAPTLHFVELGLEIKVMTSTWCPIEQLGRKFLLILDNAPSHASRLASEHYKSVLHGTVEFQPPCSPDLSPFDFFFVERAQDTPCAVSSSCQTRRNCRALLTRGVSLDADRQPLDVRKDRCCTGPQAKGLRRRQRRCFRVAQTWQTASPRSKTQRKTRHDHVICHSIARSTDRDNTSRPQMGPP